MQGSLSLRVSANKEDEPIERIKLIGNTATNINQINFTGSAEFKDSVNLKSSLSSDTSITASDGFK